MLRRSSTQCCGERVAAQALRQSRWPLHPGPHEHVSRAAAGISLTSDATGSFRPKGSLAWKLTGTANT